MDLRPDARLHRHQRQLPQLNRALLSHRTLSRRAALGGFAALAAAPSWAASHVYTALPADPLRPPAIREIPLPDFPGAHAIWGATGRDDAGGIWCGVSAVDGDHSAHLVRFDPATGTVADRGNVLGQLARLGLRRPGEKQIKLHSKILPMADGRLWFTSTDEEGEAEDGSAPPVWGSHIWSLHPDEAEWRHHLAVPEGLTCAAGGGRTIWALGLWGHVLYSFDIHSGAVARQAIGAPGGHMSRNIVADAGGHVFVPRMQRGADGTMTAELLEFAPPMTLLAATPLANYAGAMSPATAHGIIGLATLADGAIVIATSAGFLHRISPGNPATVTPLGWFHPAGPSYASALFAWDGTTTLAGLAQAEPSTWDWVVRDLATGQSRARRLELPLGRIRLIYGSDVRDDAGRIYVAGRHSTERGKVPVLLQIDPRQ
ncbi:MAG: hypothetical protein NT133_10220 [Alphaproteobacteria bacterium]|nr:hypothetical protein [Alphaproteobacteria bacterium]